MVTNGNQYRTRVPTRRQLTSLCTAFVNIEDPDVLLAPSAERFSALLRKMAFEQFGEQYSVQENLARSYSLFVDHAEGVTNALTPADWERHLGSPFADFMRIGFLLQVLSIQRGGVVARDDLRSSDVASMFGDLGPDRALHVVDQHFVASVDEHRDWSRKWEIAKREKWSPNTFQNRPLVELDGDFVAPVPHFIIDRVSPSGLYFIGLEHSGGKFTDALGHMFENYVGSQLAQLGDYVEVLSEIEYRSGRNTLKSCDYVLILPEVVLLVEVKTARPTLDYRSGTTDGLADAEKKVGQAARQLGETDRLIHERHSAFTHIPNDRPRLGLVVTLEPFHLRHTGLDNTDWVQASVPLSVVSSHDLEVFVARCIGRTDLGQLLIQAPRTETGGIDLLSVAEDLPLQRNPLLDTAFDAWCTWPDSEDLGKS